MFKILNQVLLSASDPDARHSDFNYYKRQTGPGPRDMSAIRDSKIMDTGFQMRRQSSLPRRYLDILRELMVLTPLRFEAEDEKVQAIIDDFWGGSFNDFVQWFPQLIVVGAISGRVCIPMYVGRDGRCWAGYADPAEIFDQVPFPGNPRWMDKCTWKPTGVKKPFQNIQCIRPQFEPGRHQGLYMAGSGDAEGTNIGRPQAMFYFRFNALPNEYMVLSDLSAAIDPIAQHQDYLDSQLEQAQILGRFVGDIEITEPGADDDTVERVKSKYQDVPGFATTIVHTSGEKHTMSAAHTQAQDAADRDKMHGNFATSSLGIPPHILRGDMGDANRAISSQANDPAYMKISAKIQNATIMARQLINFAIHMSVRANSLPASTNMTFQTITPKVLRKDMHSGAFTLVAINETLQSAYNARFLDHESAKEHFINAMSEIGRDDINVEQVNRRLKAEEDEYGFAMKPEPTLGQEPADPEPEPGNEQDAAAPGSARKSSEGNGGEGKGNRASK